MTVLRALVPPRLRLLTAVALVLLTITAVGCGADPRCNFAPFSGTIVGRLVSREGATATFVVSSVTRGFLGPTIKRPLPPIKPGDRATVHYAGGQAQFLHVGQSYRVGVWWFSNRFESGVHVAGVCSTGTTHANGTAIDTSVWSRSWVREVAMLSVGVAAIVVIALSFGLRGLTKRFRRR